MLVVEDDASSLGALSGILRFWGWQVRSAVTVAEALRLLDEKPACVVLDLMLPDGDGIAVLRRIRARHLPTKVVVTTGVSDAARLDEVRALAPRCLMSKPIDLDRLRECLE